MEEIRQVLRTVYLNPSTDEKLRVTAFHLGKTKNDLIREAIDRYLIELEIFQKIKLKKEKDNDQDI